MMVSAATTDLFLNSSTLMLLNVQLMQLALAIIASNAFSLLLSGQHPQAPLQAKTPRRAYRPGDFFKSHLDTPRDGLVGSLVACLPYEHTGGALVVRHNEHTVTYDWGSSDQRPAAVQWAFFYSDCEHEVQEVKSGNRLTLTYNLYASPAAGDGLPNAVDYATTPFGSALKTALDSAAFLPDGGYLGFALEHLYPHTAQGFGAAMLKGCDAIILATARQLGLKVQVGPRHLLSCGDE